MKTSSIRYGSYKYYKDSSENPINDLEQYIGIVNGLMQFIMKKVFNGFDVMLGANIGYIGIRGRKVKALLDYNGDIRGVAPDWGATKKLQASSPEDKEKKTIVYCFNEHSNGIRYNFVWCKTHAAMTNKAYYALTIARDNRRELSRQIKEENKEYLLIEKAEKTY